MCVCAETAELQENYSGILLATIQNKNSSFVAVLKTLN